MTRITLAVAAALALLAPAGQAQTQTQTQTGTDAAPPSAEAMQEAMTAAPAFTMRAASSNMFEIQSSQLALQMSQNAAVQGFASRMIDDHTTAGERMAEAARSAGLAVADMMMPDHQAQLASLAEAGGDFDQAYLAAQVAAHEEAVMLFQGHAEGGEEGELRMFATETLPTLEAHLNEAATLSSR